MLPTFLQLRQSATALCDRPTVETKRKLVFIRPFPSRPVDGSCGLLWVKTIYEYKGIIPDSWCYTPFKIRHRIIVHGVIGLAAYTPNQLLICFSKMRGVGSGGRGGKGAGGDDFYSSMQTHTSIDLAMMTAVILQLQLPWGSIPSTKAYNNQQTY
jgi:hypothetical protein